MRKTILQKISVKLSLLLFIVFLSFSSSAQKIKYSTKDKKAIEAFEKGRVHFDAGRDKLATEELEKAIKIDEEFMEARILMAQIFCIHKKFDRCIQEYQNTINVDPDFWTGVYFSLAKAQMKVGDFEKAVKNLETFLADEDISVLMQSKANKVYANAKFAANAIKNPVEFNPHNLGEAINSENSEYWPSISSDNQTFIYTRSERKQGSGKAELSEDFYIAKKDADGKWLKSTNVGPPINTRGNEGALALSPDGQFVFFVACEREDGKGSCDLYVAKRSGDLWMKPLNMGGVVNTAKWESSPTFSSDGKSLYYSSSRSGGSGGMDIWKTTFDGLRWTKPTNIKALNTRGDELAPFIHPDGKTIYFSSTGHVGMGGMDLFYSRKQKDGTWGTPVNMGYPINTIGDERGLVVNADGDLAYTVSNREGGYGKMDIYSFELYEEARPDKVTYAKGKVHDLFTNLPLGAKFELINIETHETIVESTSDDKTGEFLVCLPVNNDYALNVSKDGYLFYSENFSLAEGGSSSDPYLLDVPLQPMKMGGTVVLKNVFFNTAKYDLIERSQVELNKLVNFLQNSPGMRIEIGGHTDNVGNKQSNQILSENRAQAVKDYLTSKGIEESRLSYKGYGDEKPIATNDTPEGRQQNRRTEFKILAIQ